MPEAAESAAPVPGAPLPGAPVSGVPLPGAPVSGGTALPAGAGRRDDLLATAAALRREAAAIADRVRSLAAYDRDDVWSGQVAETSRQERADAILRLSSLHAGALVALVEAAGRLERRAEAGAGAGAGAGSGAPYPAGGQGVA